MVASNALVKRCRVTVLARLGVTVLAHVVAKNQVRMSLPLFPSLFLSLFLPPYPSPDLGSRGWV